MADTGEKIYLASEETAQEILTALDSLATDDSLTAIAEKLLSGTVEGIVTPTGFTSVKTGSTNSSSTTITGAGVLFVYYGKSYTVVVDGNSITLNGNSSDESHIMNIPFKESIVINANNVYGYYTVFLY